MTYVKSNLCVTEKKAHPTKVYFAGWIAGLGLVLALGVLTLAWLWHPLTVSRTTHLKATEHLTIRSAKLI